MFAQPVADARQRAFCLQAEEKLSCPERRCGEDNRAASEAPGMPIQPRGGLHGRDLVAIAAIELAVQRPDIHHSGLGKYGGAVLFGKIKVILIESVFGAVPAAHHAAAAAIAGGALRTFSAEERVGISLAAGLAWRRLKNADPRAVEGVGNSCGLGGALKQEVAGAEDLVLRNAEHARCSVIMLRHFGFPVSQSRPVSVVPDFIWRPKQREA